MRRYFHITLVFIIVMAALLRPSVARAQLSSLDKMLMVTDTLAWDSYSAQLKAVRRHRPTVALVLGGGGAKGAAHVGVIKYLQEIDMPVDIVLGTSMGALMGSMLSLGYTPEEIEDIVGNMPWDDMMTDRLPREYVSYRDKKYKEKYVLTVPFDIRGSRFLRSMPSAYINGRNVGNLLNSLTVGYQDSIRFNTLPIPFVCMATDLIKGKGLVCLSGSLPDALRTTMSLPMVFSPQKRNGMYLVDGGMIDNFPSDVAKALGADIIIGVSVASPDKPYSEVSNAADLVSLVIDLSGKTLLAETLKIPDVLIKPALDGLGTMSFDRESIYQLMQNGYAAACENASALDSLRQIVRQGHFPKAAKPARNLLRDSVVLRSVDITGLNDMEEKIMLHKSGLKAGQTISKAALDHGVSEMFASNMFRNVRYRLYGDGPEYDLVLECEKGPENQAGLGVRFDTEELVSAMVNIGLGARRLYGPAADLTVKLSANPYVRLDLSYDSYKAPVVNFSVDYRYANTGLMRFGNSPFSLTYMASHQELYLSGLRWRYWDLRAGLRNRWVRVMDVHSFDGAVNLDNTYWAGAFFASRLDKTDDGYFPTKGIRVDFDYNWQFNTNSNAVRDFRNNNYHSLYLDIAGVVPVYREVVSFIPSLSTRVLLTRNPETVPFEQRNFLGGSLKGRYMSHQMVFAGINNMAYGDNMLAVARLDWRFMPAPKHYITVSGHVAACADLAVAPKYVEVTDPRMMLGASLEYCFRTPLGPISANIHWSDANRTNGTRPVGFYLSAGFDF